MWQAVLPIAPDRRAGAISERTIVLEEPFKRLPGEIETIKVRIAALERGHGPQRLRVVIKAADIGKATIKRALAGMTERRMSEIVPKRDRLREILVEPERAGERARDLGNFEGMREARAVVVALVEDEHLGLVGQPPERRRMDNPIAITPEIVAGGTWRLGSSPTAALRGVGCIGSALPRRLNHHVPRAQPIDPGRLTRALGALNYPIRDLAIVQ